MVSEWVETFQKILSDPEPLHCIAFDGETYNLFFSQKKNDCKCSQSKGQAARIYRWVHSHLFQHLPIICGQFIFPALKYLGSETGQIQTTGGIFGRLNTALSKELLRNMSQMALAEQRLMYNDSAIEKNLMKVQPGSVWKERSELLQRLQEGRVAEIIGDTWEQKACDLELKLRKAVTEADTLRKELEIARKESPPVLIRRLHKLLEEKDKASVDTQDLNTALTFTKTYLDETKTKLRAEVKKCDNLRNSNLELKQELKKVREERDHLEALLTEVMAMMAQQSEDRGNSC